MSTKNCGVEEYGLVLNFELFKNLLLYKENKEKLDEFLNWLEIKDIEELNYLGLSDIAQEIGFSVYSQFTGETYNSNYSIEDKIYFEDEIMFIMYLEKDNLFQKYESWNEIYMEIKETLLKYGIKISDEFIKKHVVQVTGTYWG